MPSMKCHECKAMKDCKMYTRPLPGEPTSGDTVDGTGRTRVLIVYLCRFCARSLEYTT